MSKQDQNIMLGFSPHQGQQRILKDLMFYYDEYPTKLQKHYFTLNIGRQWGKSLMVCNFLLWVAINHPKQDCVYITPTYKLAKKLFREFMDAIEGAPCIKSINKTDLQVEFVNGSICRFGSGENPMSWRGFTLSLLIIDEAAFCQSGLWTVMEPTLRVKGRMAIFISTPNGRNWFWNLCSRGQSELDNWHYHSAPSWESPYINRAELDEIKKHSELQWRIEYNAEFIDDEMSVFRDVDGCVLESEIQPSEKDQVYIGLDLGKKNDYTVAVAINQNHEILDILRTRQQDWTQILDQIQSFYQKWRPIYGYAETNFNDRIVDELVNERYCKNLKPFFTNAVNKSEMVQNLVLLVNKKELKIPQPIINKNFAHLITELKQYTYRYNPETGKMKYGSPRDLHDDCVSSLMLACMAIKDKRPSKSGLIWDRL